MEEKKFVFEPRIKRDNIGTYHPRSDAFAKASGQARYTEDMTSKWFYPNEVYMKLMKCPYPHARIISMNTDKAAAYPGVVGILRYDDPEIMAFPMTSDAWTDAVNTCDMKRGWTTDALDRIILGPVGHWMGDELGCAIAADSWETAEEAMKLVEVEWEVLPFTTNVADSIREGAPILHPDINPESNYIPNFKNDPFVDRGNVDEAFARADVVVETHTEHGNATECAMDYWCCLADWTGDELLMISNAYANDQQRYFLHKMLGLPINKVRVIIPFQGGSHGRGNCGEQQFFVLACLMSKKCGYPVKYHQTRKETFHTTRTRQYGHVKIGAMKDGTITAVQTHSTGESGAYYLLCGGSIRGVPGEWSELSLGKIPNVRMIGDCIYTNIIPSSCMRSIGNIQINFMFGAAMDRLAEVLGMDPVELALKNINNEVDESPNPSLAAVLKAGSEAIGWANRHAPGEGPVFEGTKRRGLGFSCNNSWHTEAQEYRRGATQVMIKLNPDGSVILDAPTVETGTATNMCGILAAADGLGISVDRIKWTSVQDTQTGLKDQVQTDSGAAALLAECAYECGLEVKRQFLTKVAARLERNVDELDMKNGRAFVVADPSIGMTVEEYHDVIDLNEEGDLVPISHLQVRPLSLKNYGHSYMCTFVEVEVDTETGEVQVLRQVISTDGGTVLYATGAEGQMIGGQSIGVGEALYEGIIYDHRTGTPLNFNFVDYKFPTIEDFPGRIDPIPVEVYKGRGEFGAMGMAESAPCSTPRAISNAIYNAIGVHMDQLPITPMKILNALEEKECE